MSAVKSTDLQDSATECLTSQTDQPTRPRVLPPVSTNLSVDKELKLSNENFKQLIESSFDTNIIYLTQLTTTPHFPTPHKLAHFASKPNCDFFKCKVVTPLSQLTATPPFPTPHVLAQFASKAYEGHKRGETDAQYETRLALPDGWKLLTTASNGSLTNGYFGAAFWHPEHQQVVVAHRGTKFTNFGAPWTDVFGVVFENHVPQMGSASTFAYKVVEVLQEVNRIKGVSFQLFFTGHSLGGWLAQITTFTTKCLKKDGNFFVTSNNDKDCFHPHTVVFESPGCKEMLSQLRDTFDVRLEGRSIDIEHLDITSYLSAPNLINTCKTHLGTVYRMFTDLSDMSWWEKGYVLYTITTHEMDKILKIFDSQAGQVHKDGEGQLKVHVVIDWPISAGFKGIKEYLKFFEWAKHLHNYHPVIKDESYCSIRYQTELYDERVNSFRIFSEEEQEFLRSYHWLRQWPELFKPKELFCVLENNQAQNKAEMLLQNFEIKNDKIHCIDSNELQTLIPYVKRLLQLFPPIKEITKRALSSDEVRKKVYQFETIHYVERIRQSAIDFNPDSLKIKEFLESDHQRVLQLQMDDGNEWTGLIKVHQVLQKTGCLNAGQYIVLKLERLLTVNKFIDFSKLMQSTPPQYLLLTACEKGQPLKEEAKGVIREIFRTIKQTPSVKVIFSACSERGTQPSLQQIATEIFGEAFVTRNNKLNWGDITTESQGKLLEKSARFQGSKISLSEIICAESPIVNHLPLGTLLEEKEFKIADPVQISNAHIEDYYINRTLRRQQAIKEDIVWDKCNQKFPDLLVRTEEEFRKFCHNNPNRNVHWLQEDKSGKLLWQRSQGSLEKLHRYIDTESSYTHTYKADDLEKLLEQAQHQGVMLISDKAGMGKSTLLTHLSKQIKKKFPGKWVVRIDLNDHTDALQTLQKQIDKGKAIDFVSKELLKPKPGLEMELFKQSCDQEQKVRIVMMLDGFDEISPDYKETVFDLLQALKQTAVEQLWVTTRPHLREELENKLQQLSYTLEPFSEENKMEFLKEYWIRKEWFTVAGRTVEEGKSKLEIYAKKLCEKLGQSINDRDKDFTGVPLQCRMLAEAFDEDVKTFYLSQDSLSDVTFKLDLLDIRKVYEKFIEKKYEIYQKEKCKEKVSIVAVRENRESDLKIMRKDHQLLALKVLFTEEQVKLFQMNKQCTFTESKLAKIGIAEFNNKDKLRFIHRTFAEYYVGDFFVYQLNKGKKPSPKVLDCLFKDIFLKEEYRVVRVFIDGLMSKDSPSKEVLKECGDRKRDLGEVSEMVLYHAACEGNANIIEFLLDNLQEADDTDSLKQLLLAQYKGRHTAWHVAGKWGNVQVLQKLWDWGKEKLTTEELHNKYLLARDSSGKTAWHVAAEEGKLEVLQQLREWAKMGLKAEEFNDKFLLAGDGNEQTFLHVAAKRDNTKEFEKLWDWATKKLTAEEMRDSFLAKDHLHHTVLNVAANRSNKYVFRKLWKYVTENLTEDDIQMLFSSRQ